MAPWDGGKMDVLCSFSYFYASELGDSSFGIELLAWFGWLFFVYLLLIHFVLACNTALV
jgi:hypothetical protein